MAALGVLLVAACVLDVSLGVISIAPADTVSTLLGQGSRRDELVLFEIRLPRIAVAMLVGVGLALSGTILQGITQNVLADPGILGINACAGLAVFVFLAFGGAMSDLGPLEVSAYSLPLAALAGGSLGATLIYLLAYQRGAVTPTRLLLVGVGIAFGATACIPVLARMLPSSSVYQYAASWLEGSVSGASWDYVNALWPWIAVLAPIALYKSQTLNVLGLGDAVAGGLGVAVQRQRLLLVAIAVGLAASSVAIGGGIAFVGLMAPHLGRRLVGPDHRILIPAAALIGALLLVLADVVAQNALAPYQIPIGIVVALVGAPYFLYLLVRTAG